MIGQEEAKPTRKAAEVLRRDFYGGIPQVSHPQTIVERLRLSGPIVEVTGVGGTYVASRSILEVLALAYGIVMLTV